MYQTNDSSQLLEFAQTNQLRYPIVLGQDPGNGSKLQLLLTAEDLAGVSKSHSEFLSLLLERAKDKGINLESRSE